MAIDNIRTYLLEFIDDIKHRLTTIAIFRAPRSASHSARSSQFDAFPKSKKETKKKKNQQKITTNRIHAILVHSRGPETFTEYYVNVIAIALVRVEFYVFHRRLGAFEIVVERQ